MTLGNRLSKAAPTCTIQRRRFRTMVMGNRFAGLTMDDGGGMEEVVATRESSNSSSSIVDRGLARAKPGPKQATRGMASSRARIRPIQAQRSGVSRPQPVSRAALSVPTMTTVAQPIVWIDCEMTGLAPSDKIIEIAVIITNGQLELVHPGLNLVIHQPKEVMRAMGAWCQETHGRTGLTKQVEQSKLTTSQAEDQVLEYIQQYVPERVGILAGSSVHADKVFLVKEMPKIIDWLHYRIIDVSSIKELKNRWYPNLLIPRAIETQQGTLHRALDDIKASIEELKGYRETIFVPSKSNDSVEQELATKLEATALASSPSEQTESKIAPSGTSSGHGGYCLVS